MNIPEIYQPEQWHDFFIIIASSAAVLTGTLFVAISLHVNEIVKDYVLRHRALSILVGLTASFIIGSFMLMAKQNHLFIGCIFLIVCGISMVIGIRSYIQVLRYSKNAPGSIHRRTFGSILCYLAQSIGAIILISGSLIGLYIAAAAQVLLFYYLISGSWLLLIGITNDSNQK